MKIPKKERKPKRALIIFIKNPIKGTVKTRLAKDVGDDRALEIYQKLLAHTRTVALELSLVDRCLFYLDEIWDDEWSLQEFRKKLQGPGDLGAKMHHAFTEVLKEADQAVIIGSDCAQLTSEIILRAFKSLNEYDVVVGPTYDGGYYLLGMSEAHSFLFEDMTWSVNDVFEVTISRIKKAELSYSLTTRLSDIDHEEDWVKYGLD